MIETSGVIEKEQGNGFYLVTLEQPEGHQCLFEQDYKLTTNEEILHKENKSTLKNSVSGLSFIALFFCGEQLDALTRDNKYMIDKEKYTKILVQGTNRSAKKSAQSMILRPSALEQHICRGVGSI